MLLLTASGGSKGSTYEALKTSFRSHETCQHGQRSHSSVSTRPGPLTAIKSLPSAVLRTPMPSTRVPSRNSVMLHPVLGFQTRTVAKCAVPVHISTGGIVHLHVSRSSRRKPPRSRERPERLCHPCAPGMRRQRNSDALAGVDIPSSDAVIATGLDGPVEEIYMPATSPLSPLCLRSSARVLMN